MKILIFLLISNSLVSQSILDSIDFESKEPLINDKNFVFNIVTLDSIFNSCIDTIISSYPLEEDECWYLDFTNMKKTKTFTLSLSNIERFVYINKNIGLLNKAILLYSQVVFIRVKKCSHICSKTDSCIVFKNNKKETFLEIGESSYWTFKISGSKISLLSRIIW